MTHKDDMKALILTVLIAQMSHYACGATNSLVSQFLLDNVDSELVASANELLAEFNELGAADTNLLGWVVRRDAAEQQITKLEADITAREQILASRQSELTNILRRIELLKLSPEQLKTVSEYNRTISKDPTFPEWLGSHVLWFEVGKDVLIGIAFFLLGVWWDRRQAQRTY